MNLRLAQTAALLAATITTGLTAGLFVTFAHAIMPGLGRGSDRTLVEGMDGINVAILNGWFWLCFMGGLPFTIAALALLVSAGRPVLPWVIAALVLYGVMFLVTMALNVPLNDELAKTAATAGPAELAAAREHFETRWVAWNVVRAVSNTAAFVALTWALVLHGRATAGTQHTTQPPAAAHQVPAEPVR